MSEFSDWVTRIARDRGLETEAELSRAINTSQSIIGRWRMHGTVPEMKTLRRVAESLNVPIQEALVAAGYVRPEEVGFIQIKLGDVATRDLLLELARRLGEDEIGGVGEVPAMRSSRPADPGEPTWHQDN
ncbi:helix-turn-helix domain-containing protein [Promicromonospora sukumoe]